MSHPSRLRAAAVWIGLTSAILGGACAGGPSPLRTSQSSGPFVGSKRNGYWTLRDDNGIKTANGSYVNDRLTGRWNYFFPSGTKKWDVGYRDEKFDGPSTWWREDGAARCAGSFVAGLETGQWTYWNDNGSIAVQGDFDRGRRHLGWAYWDRNGKPLAEGYAYRGERVGVWGYWNPAGEHFAETFAMPSGVSLHREVWDDGAPRREGFLENGVRTGRWVTRHENGLRRVSGELNGDTPVGEWFAWTPDGRLLARLTFNNGKLAPNWTVWSAEGEERSREARLLRLEPFAGKWSATSEAEGKPVERVLDVWLSEALSPLGANQPLELDPAAPKPPAELAAVAAQKPALPLERQEWTDEEQQNMEFLVKLYSDGAPRMNAPSGSRAYSRGLRGQAKQVENGDERLSSPLIGRRIQLGKVRGRDGKPLDPNALAGKPVVVTILRGMAGEVCVYCYTQVRALCDAMPEFRAAGAEVIVVYPGESDRLETFWAALSESEQFEGREAPFTFAYDPDFELVRSLSIEGKLALPTTLVLGADGTIRFAYVGANTADRPDAARLLEQVKKLR